MMVPISEIITKNLKLKIQINKLSNILPNMLKIPSLFWLIKSNPLLSESRYMFNPFTKQLWYPEWNNFFLRIIKSLHMHNMLVKIKEPIESIPIRIMDPRIPQYCGGRLTMGVRIDTAASVKKKFQCTPYSPA